MAQPVKNIVYQEPPLFFDGRPEEHIRKVAITVRDLQQGRTNNICECTLDPDSDSTEVLDDRISINTVFIATPKTESAARLFGSGSLWFETTKGRLVIHHDNQPDTDRVFALLTFG